jgi:chromosome partitioning protein
MVMDNIVASFERYARLCREVQERAIALENHPEHRKRLRRFPAREIAEILGISASHLRNLVREPGFPPGELHGGGRRSFSFEDLGAARAWLHRTTGNQRYALPARGSHDHLQAVAFVNFKGGSGKTTSASHFAQWLVLQGYRVLLVDLDPQASATALMGLTPAVDVRESDTFAAWIRRDAVNEEVFAKQLVRQTYWPALDLLPANIGLQHAEYDLVGNLLRQRDWPFYAQLQSLLTYLAPKYDVAVIDCRPDVGMLTINALVAATGLVVPIPPSMIDFASSGEFFRFMAEIARDLRKHLSTQIMSYDFVRVLTTKHRSSDRNQTEMMSWTRALFGEAVLENSMLETSLMDAAGILKETLYEYEPTGNRRSYERGLEAMNGVNRSLEQELLRAWGQTPNVRREVA